MNELPLRIKSPKNFNSWSAYYDKIERSYIKNNIIYCKNIKSIIFLKEYKFPNETIISDNTFVKILAIKLIINDKI